MIFNSGRYRSFILFVLFGVAAAASFFLLKENNQKEPIEYVTIAILAKDKAHTLPLYLSCIEEQTWPKNKTYLYIRTNNNNDNTREILHNWVEKVRGDYAGVFFDDSDVVQQVQNYKQHEWNTVRFKVLGKIRQDSVGWAHQQPSHYFVADCDNFIVPKTIETMVETNLPIVAPLLMVADDHPYSNFHAAINRNGYYAESRHYQTILQRKIRGLIKVPVVHCTYLIRHNVSDKITYDDKSKRYEYVIFSDSARKQKIPQYLDNRELYGRITFAETAEDLSKEPWLHEFEHAKEKTPL